MYNLFRIVFPLDDGLEDQDEHEDEDECECEQAKGCVCRKEGVFWKEDVETGSVT